VGNDRTLALAALLLVTGCAATPDERTGECSAAIQGGVPDARDKGVVGVAMLDAEHHHIRRTCSGTLVAPNLVLTAQHCVAETSPFVDCKKSTFGALDDADRLRVTTSASIWSSDAEWVTAREVIVPPGPPNVCGRDVALLVLASCIDGDHAAPLSPKLDTLPDRGEMYSAIGFGASQTNGGDAGDRRRREALHVVCVGGACGSRQIEDGEWRGDHGICSGDSGGPAVDGQGLVIGVTSRGPKGCDDPIYGAISGHSAWLRDVARRVARDGAYGDPEWVADGPAQIPHAASCGDVRPTRGCTAAGAGRAGDASRAGDAGWIVGMLGALIAARRGRRG
jgi:hypothetical protein